MKVTSYRNSGRDTYGVVTGDGVCDVGKRLGQRFPDLKAVIVAGALDEVAKAATGQAPDAKLTDITFLPVIGNPGKILMAGVNYHAHRAEMGRNDSTHPTIFARWPDSQVGHNQPMIRPRESDKFDYEGELAVVIGRRGHRIAKERALDYICGYACYNDGSIRDWQRHTSQWTPGKNWPGTGAFGPWMVTADEIKDPTKLTLITRLNGQEMQHATTDLLIFDIPTLINYCSTFVPLMPGDVIVTGTPGGVGFARNPPVFMKAGDVVEVDISSVGVLRSPIKAED
ncbi:MAG: fumarylacetoacetate hydrolase family protein [Alphaproteobacteria bacterium]|nr:fumarylacetoacetate hydrolase family protein [Alphaproteobacteria bacterium]